MNTYSDLVGFFLARAQVVFFFFFFFSSKPYLCSNRFLINWTIFSCSLFHVFHVPSKNGTRTCQNEKSDYCYSRTTKNPPYARKSRPILQGYDSKTKAIFYKWMCRPESLWIFLLSENIFSSISLSCVITVWGLLEGAEFYQMLVLLKCTWLLNYKQLM